MVVASHRVPLRCDHQCLPALPDYLTRLYQKVRIFILLITRPYLGHTSPLTTQFSDLVELSSGTAEDIFNAQTESLEAKKIPLENFVGFSLDTTNVMVVEHNSMFSKLKEKLLHMLHNHFLEVETLLHELEALGATLDETDTVLTMPEKFNNVVTAIETMTSNITLEFVKGRLLYAELLMLKNQSSQEHGCSFTVQRSKMKCYECGAYGHFKAVSKTKKLMFSDLHARKKKCFSQTWWIWAWVSKG
ncbi:hypothetical protein PR048_012892 [Dryococelus australis]|uniref:Uncharacterized protein n=1 Tax=Dryococelus australis TaxID=614101 RepID=A0ABQ9HQM6_9NEOP|nr:hypothetical protein PR048_012892 [Dryococelus australis]